MKWIGQHIYDFISRFRNDVYLESVAESAQDHVVGIDADGKLFKQDVSTGDITGVTAGDALTGGGADGNVTINHEDTSSQASVNNSGRAFIQDITLDTYGHVTNITSATDADTYSGTVTSFVAQTDSGSGARYSTTTAPSIQILGATGVGVTNSAGVITATAVAGEIDHDSLSNFVTAEHVDWAASGAGTIHTDNYVENVVQTTVTGSSGSCTGNAATATNLTASTSTAVGLGTIELGHATDTTIARSAAGVVTIEGNKIETRKTLLHLQQTSFSRDIATTEFFIPLNSTAESTSITNVNVPMVMPVAGKLLKIHFKVNQHHNGSSNTMTFKLYDVDDGETWSTGNSDILGTKVIDGPAREDIGEADFTDLTTSGASGTNAFAAGDLIGITVKNSADLATTNYLFTFVFELDFNSY